MTFDKESVKNLKKFSLHFSKIRDLESVLNSISDAKNIKSVDLKDNNIEVKNLKELSDLINHLKSKDFFRDLEVLDLSNDNEYYNNNGEIFTHDTEFTFGNFMSFVSDKRKIKVEGDKDVMIYDVLVKLGKCHNRYKSEISGIEKENLHSQLNDSQLNEKNENVKKFLSVYLYLALAILYIKKGYRIIADKRIKD